MRVLVAGAGNVGVFVAKELREGGHEVALIEIDADRVNLLQAADEPPGVAWFVGDGCEVSELARAEPDKADVVVVLTGDDEDNLVISLLAKQEFAVPRVIARVNNPKNEWLFNESWGIDLSVSTPHLLAGLVEEAVSVGSLVRLLAFEGGQARLVEVTLAGDSPAIGQPIADVAFPRDSTVVAVIRQHNVVVPRGDTTFHERDEVIVLVTGDSEDRVCELLIGLEPHERPEDKIREQVRVLGGEGGEFHKRPTSW
jgi:trk system potassium uptake protein TrkA